MKTFSLKVPEEVNEKELKMAVAAVFVRKRYPIFRLGSSTCEYNQVGIYRNSWFIQRFYIW